MCPIHYPSSITNFFLDAPVSIQLTWSTIKCRVCAAVNCVIHTFTAVLTATQKPISYERGSNTQYNAHSQTLPPKQPSPFCLGHLSLFSISYLFSGSICKYLQQTEKFRKRSKVTNSALALSAVSHCETKV